MTWQGIILDLKSRGENNIRFNEKIGVIISRHGKYTTNYWIEVNGELKCIDCKTSYN